MEVEIGSFDNSVDWDDCREKGGVGRSEVNYEVLCMDCGLLDWMFDCSGI